MPDPPLSIPLFLKRGGRSLEKEQLCTRNALLIRITRHVPLCHLEQPHGERARQHETTGHHAIKYNIKTVGANTLCVTSIRDCTRPF